MLIGLNGRKSAGKDTVYERTAHIMADVVEVERASFADLLYESAAAAVGVSVEFLRQVKNDPRFTVNVLDANGDNYVAPRTIREYLQAYGTEAHRDVFGPDFWVEQLGPRLRDHKDRIVMVTDVRFPNEAEAVRAAGGVVVEIVGPEGRVTADAHASEAPLPAGLVDVVIQNTVRDDNFRALDKIITTLFRTVLWTAAPC